MSKTYEFISSAEWRGQRLCEVFVGEERNSRGITASAPVFQGLEGAWNPEDMLCSALASCIIFTFLHFVNQNSIALISCKDKVTATLTKGMNGFSFTNFTIEAEAVVERGHKEKAEEAWKLTERFCLVSNSLIAPKELRFSVTEKS